MSLLSHLLSVFVATNSPAAAVSNEVQAATGISVPLVDANDPMELELKRLMMDDDAATDDADKWIKENEAFSKDGAGVSNEELNRRILARFDAVRKAYEDFLRRYPDSARGHMAYGSFLNDIGKEDDAMVEFEKARQLDPKNPAVWNNLANYYGEFSPVTNAFAYYAKAIELNPLEPVYYQNFATTVYLFRKDATNYFGITEPEVFDKSLALYRKAMQLAPDDLPLATDYAQSYYGIRPLRTNDALMSWTNALSLAHNETEREGIYIHLARIKIAISHFEEARAHLDAITNAAYAEMRKRLERNLAEKLNPTNATTVVK